MGEEPRWADGGNVSLTLLVLYRLTGNGALQAPSKAIILRAARAKRSVHARSTRTDRSPRRAAATTLIGLCNCLAKHCGKRPALICLLASNRFLNADSRRPDSAVQETAERARARGAVCVAAFVSLRDARVRIVCLWLL